LAYDELLVAPESLASLGKEGLATLQKKASLPLLFCCAKASKLSQGQPSTPSSTVSRPWSEPVPPLFNQRSGR
jgi:hypothetical protein